ncbi:MAG: ATP-binding cassette domain-containing protein [Pseudomonadota bacterium]
MVATLFPVGVEEAIVQKRGKRLIGPVTASFDKGGPHIVIGPNGAGKTTLLRLIHGLERARAGHVSYGSCELREAYRRQSFVFQKPIMLARSALENMMYPLRLHGVSRGEARSQAEAALDAVGLSESTETRATFLSGGETQKLAIGRALITKPELLILDEPTASLDGSATRDIENLIMKAAEDGVEIIMTTHDMGQARRLAACIFFLHHGKLVEKTDAAAFFAKPQSEAAHRFINGEII